MTHNQTLYEDDRYTGKSYGYVRMLYTEFPCLAVIGIKVKDNTVLFGPDRDRMLQPGEVIIFVFTSFEYREE
ncbi:hypothetical protein C4579_01295 [Candidatus Microgenomates bacterium]|nr:MAG: hypothetical protein C4579_01295 [Candidatus Microgenomates bacterium]